MLPNVPYPTVSKSDQPDPPEEAGTGCYGNQDHPKPDEDVDLLVEEVDRQDALDRVPVDVPHLSDLEIAQRYPGEADGSLERLTADYVPDDLQSVQVIVLFRGTH